MYTFLKRVAATALLMSATLTTSAMSADGEADRSRAGLVFSGFLNDGPVFSTYGYSRQTREIFASVHVSLPGNDKPLVISRTMPTRQFTGEQSNISSLFRHAWDEVRDIVKRSGGLRKGHQTFGDDRKAVETAAADGLGNSVGIVSKPASAKECRGEVLNGDGRFHVKINEETFSVLAPAGLCLVQGYVTGMWSYQQGEPTAVASLLFVSEDGDQHAFLAGKRPERSFLAQVSSAALN